MDTAIYAAQRMALVPPQGASSMPESSNQSQGEDEQYISTFFCKALYDYQSNDASSLSFRKNDIIEVLTRLDSGWWDGLLGDERGWFPSNYVSVISDQEAEVALSPSAYDGAQATPPDDTMLDMGDTMSRALSESDRDGDWLERDADFSVPSQRTDGHSSAGGSNGTQHHDFWVPQFGADGRVSTDLAQYSA